jgi:hypothetical protein
MIDVYVRTVTEDRFWQVMQNRGLAQQVTNPDTGQPVWVPTEGVHIDRLGNMVITPAVMDGLTVVTPAVIDPWFSFNVRLSGQKFLDDQDTVLEGEDAQQPWRFIRSKLVRFVRNQSTLVNLNVNGNNVRAYQFGTGDNRFQILDPRDVAGVVPRTEWLGGMNL